MSVRTLRLAALAVLGPAGACSVGEPVVDRLRGGDAGVLDCPYIPACDADGGVEVTAPIFAPCGGAACTEVSFDELASSLSFGPRLARVEVDAPTERRLSGIELSEARIELAGPVSLVIDGHSALTAVELVLDGRAGEPRVTFEDADLDLVRVMTEGEGLVGELRLSRVRATRVDLAARSLDAQGSELDGSRLTASTLALADVDLTEVALSADVASAAAANFQDVVTEGCGSFTFARGSVTGQRSRLGPCTDLLRVYDAQVSLADLSGPLQADGATLSKVTLGARGAVSLDGFALKLTGARLCPGVGALRFGDESAARCVSCEEPPALDPCRMSLGPLEVLESDCPSFFPVDDDGLAQCAPPWGIPERPL